MFPKTRTEQSHEKLVRGPYTVPCQDYNKKESFIVLLSKLIVLSDPLIQKEKKAPKAL